MGLSSNGQDGRLSTFKYEFDSRWPYQIFYRGSLIGKTPDFESGFLGSYPSPGANFMNEQALDLIVAAMRDMNRRISALEMDSEGGGDDGKFVNKMLDELEKMVPNGHT